MSVPRWDPGDRTPILWIALLPLLAALPQLLGWVHTDPLLYRAAIDARAWPGLVHGYPYIDPNDGYTTQSLGYRAALDWLRGVVPWWNPYSGIGLPLAGEYQPAAFFPLTLLLLLPQGVLWQHIALQVLAGWGAYALLRHLDAGRAAACIGGILFGFNGTLAWFAHGPAQAAPFLPWMLAGIERAHAFALARRRGGWRLFALAMGFGLLAGFPETTYIGGLLALCWAIVRGAGLARALRAGFAARVALGGIVGLCIAAPQLLAFFDYLPQAFVGIHDEVVAHARLHPLSWVPTLVAPYAWGPIFAYIGHWPQLVEHWGGSGGYVTIALLVVAAYGLAARRGPLAWLLAGWCLATVGKSADLPIVTPLVNLVPGVALAAFARYVQPTWELALAILAAWGLDSLARDPVRSRTPLHAARAVQWIALGAALWVGFAAWPHLRDSVSMRNWALGSAAWAVATALGCTWLLARPSTRAWRALAALLVADAILMLVVPTLSGFRHARPDFAGVGFLREHLGLQRFYTIGPIQPNYGAYFGIASINHNYLPVSRRWVDWIHARLDRAADPVVFNGSFPRAPGQPSAAEELRANLAGYRAAAVKFVTTLPGVDPFGPPADPARPPAKLVYEDAAMRIFELTDPSPYFDPLGGDCTVQASERTHARVQCRSPGRLVRRELFFPGWSAEVNGRDVAIDPYDGAFQSIAVPAGASEVRLRYAPPHVEWAWLAFILGCLALTLPRRSPLRKAR